MNEILVVSKFVCKVFFFARAASGRDVTVAGTKFAAKTAAKCQLRTISSSLQEESARVTSILN